jgi:alpha-tubulin suppressor-like RCC1 family protein
MMFTFIETNLIYSMGSNQFGQLGVGDLQIVQRTTPILVESLTFASPKDVYCGGSHTLAVMGKTIFILTCRFW